MNILRCSWSCPCGARCGSLVSPTPSSTLTRCRAGPRGCRSPSAVRSPKGSSVRTSSPSLLSGAVPIALADFGGLLSWVPSTHPSHVTGRCACRPSTDMLVERPLPRRRPVVASAPRVPPPKSRSALVVSHHLDGFLRSTSRGPVASRSRSWGPPRFCVSAPRSEDRDVRSLPRDAGPYPSKESSPTAGTRHRVRCPLAVPCPITASPRLFPLPFAGLSWWEDRERRLRGLAPSSSLVPPPPFPVVSGPLLPGLRSSSRSFHRGRRSRLPPPSLRAKPSRVAPADR